MAGPTIHPKRRRWNTADDHVILSAQQQQLMMMLQAEHHEEEEQRRSFFMPSSSSAATKRNTEPLLLVCCARSTSGEPLTQTFVALPHRVLKVAPSTTEFDEKERRRNSSGTPGRRRIARKLLATSETGGYVVEEEEVNADDGEDHDASHHLDDSDGDSDGSNFSRDGEDARDGGCAAPERDADDDHDDGGRRHDDEQCADSRRSAKKVTANTGTSTAPSTAVANSTTTTSSSASCCENDGDDDLFKFIIGPHYLLGEKRFYYFVPLLAALDVLFCILGSFGMEPILPSPSAALDTPQFFAITAYVVVADLIAVAACSRPSLVKTTVSLVVLVPKLFFVLLDASTFFAVGVWLTIVVVVLVATARSGISWHIVDVPIESVDDDD